MIKKNYDEWNDEQKKKFDSLTKAQQEHVLKSKFPLRSLNRFNQKHLDETKRRLRDIYDRGKLKAKHDKKKGIRPRPSFKGSFLRR